MKSLILLKNIIIIIIIVTQTAKLVSPMMHPNPKFISAKVFHVFSQVTKQKQIVKDEQNFDLWEEKVKVQ